MYANEMREKSVQELEQELLGLNKEAFSLRMQKATDQLPKSHQIKAVRRKIARLMTILSEKTKTAAVDQLNESNNGENNE